MSTHYRLIPPFLYVAEEQDFSKAWELFCCKLLNLSNKTTEIYVRNPPEQGVDIYDPSKKIAYQCKSIESGKSGDFNVTHVVKSIEAAKLIQAELKWERYVLCVNVAISGIAEATLKKALPDIEIFPNSHWVGLCEKNPVEVERNFRRLIEVPRARVLDAIHNRFLDHYSEQLKQNIEDSSFDVFLYSNRHDTAYRVPVSDNFSCQDLLGIFREFFKLPESTIISTEGIYVSLSHSVVFNGKKISRLTSLKNAGISHGSVITYWTTILWKDADTQFKGDVINMMTSHIPNITLSQRRKRAIAVFSEDLRQCFHSFDNTL
ncbi:hypothetical protein [Serratia plymuthica]|uniref:Uncharacterized protein n=1 Tax=Serratia plymuthica TaxID=82996 RepID=A0A2X4V5K5_SERPL|nr:hypothetical protein [Serratia plymuthica]QPS20112.1 hypothetical protein I6G64_21510 [Serratia plymuthica]QPS61727.1 hypothetical protein I6G52_16770 [Serratia plymuthica]RKS61187.1 hypothetical protein C8E17_0303 [Serratia plymuthica]CAI2473973.1 Uncharacterised protein [Serratia plymuthica]SQI43488.1 Uncharacterised protein [Serratia plymuthica]